MNEISQQNLKAVEAYLQGKPVQRRHVDSTAGVWHPLEGNVNWQFEYYQYRPTPVPKVIYVNEYPRSKIVHDTLESAKNSATGTSGNVVRIGVKYTEVIE